LPPAYSAKIRLLENLSRWARNDDAAVRNVSHAADQDDSGRSPPAQRLTAQQPFVRLPQHRDAVVGDGLRRRRDLTPPVPGREVVITLPNGSYLQIPDGGHLGFMERVEAVDTAALKSFGDATALVH
jgi:hypothetical protein